MITTLSTGRDSNMGKTEMDEEDAEARNSSLALSSIDLLDR